MIRLLLFLVLWPAIALASESYLIDFEIEDQFKKKHTDEDYLGRIVVVVGSDKDGSEFNSIWGSALTDSLRHEPGYDRLVYLPVPDVRGVPFFLKGMIRGKFPKEKDKWALVDWKGRFAKTYEFEAKASNILVFDPRGRLIHHASGRELDLDTLDALLAVLRPLVTRPLD